MAFRVYLQHWNCLPIGSVYYMKNHRNSSTSVFSSEAMNLFLRYFITSWVFVELLYSHIHASIFSPIAKSTQYNLGFQININPEPTSFTHVFRGAHQLRQAGSNPTCGWIDGNEGMSESRPDFRSYITRAAVNLLIHRS